MKKEIEPIDERPKPYTNEEICDMYDEYVKEHPLEFEKGKRFEITRELCEKVMLITDINVTDDGTVLIYRNHKNKPLKRGFSNKEHPYGTNRKYAIIGWDEHDRSKKFRDYDRGMKCWVWRFPNHTAVVSRVVYAWFKGPVPADMDIDHIDNNCLNDHPDNLRLVTRSENIKKKYYGDCSWVKKWYEKYYEINGYYPGFGPRTTKPSKYEREKTWKKKKNVK